MRKGFIALLIILSTLLSFVPMAATAASEVIIDSLNVDAAGHAEVIGRVSGGVAGETQVSCLVHTADWDISKTALTGDNVLWIDQRAVGNNGVFLFEFEVRPKYSQKSVVFNFGSDAGEVEKVKMSYTIPTLAPDIECVANNSVLYGNDVYMLDSTYLTAQNVTDSIKHGSNIIYFKVGDNWYNLLDPEATSNAYLVKANAVSLDNMRKLKLRYYYTTGNRTDFK